jgi:hypothetical protein
MALWANLHASYFMGIALVGAFIVGEFGRADMYREGIFDDFMTVQNVAPAWREVLARYKVDFVIIVPGSSLDYALAHEPGWQVAYKDEISIMYQGYER